MFNFIGRRAYFLWQVGFDFVRRAAKVEIIITGSSALPLRGLTAIDYFSFICK